MKSLAFFSCKFQMEQSCKMFPRSSWLGPSEVLITRSVNYQYRDRDLKMEGSICGYRGGHFIRNPLEPFQLWECQSTMEQRDLSFSTLHRSRHEADIQHHFSSEWFSLDPLSPEDWFRICNPESLMINISECKPRRWRQQYFLLELFICFP